MTAALNKNKSQRSMRLQSDKSHRRLVEYFVVVSSVPHDQADIDDTPVVSLPSLYNINEKHDGEFEKAMEQRLNMEPIITARYPIEDHEKNPLLHDSVISFCHPSDEMKLKSEGIMPKVHYFVTTGGRGTQIYGICLTVYEPFIVKLESPGETKDVELFRPKCICILSVHPYLVAFREYLTQLERLSRSGEMSVPIERYIMNFCSEVAAPPPGSFEVQTTIADSVIKFWSPPYNQPIAWVSLPFSQLFECLDIDNIITTWHALALERQVLVISTQKSLLTTVCEILVSLLFPMRWSHAYIPLVPKFLISILSAPMPFLCGIDKSLLNEALKHLGNECIIIDLDTNVVSMGPSTPELPSIPPEFETKLRATLKEHAGMVFREARSLNKGHDFSDRGEHLPLHVKVTADAMWESKLCLYDEAFILAYTPEQEGKNYLNGNDGGQKTLGGSSVHKKTRIQSRWDAVQEAFMSLYVGLLSSYRQCLVFPSKDGNANIDGSSSTGSYGGAGFKSKQFLKLQRANRRLFLRELVNTQMFDEFITKRLYGSGASDVTFFDLAIDNLLKAYDSEIDRSFHPENSNSLTIETSARPMSAPGRGVRRFLRSRSGLEKQKPLLMSSAVHRRLKTIVPPEPLGVGLPLSGPQNASSGFYAQSTTADNDDENSIESKGSKETQSTAQSSPLTSFESPGSDDIPAMMHSENKPSGMHMKSNYTYPVFPTKLDDKLFGKPRPLPAAILAEFERQKEHAVQFRKLNNNGKKESKDPAKSPEETTFTVFFMALSAVIGRDIQKLSSSKHMVTSERNILATCGSFTDDDSIASEQKNLEQKFNEATNSDQRPRFVESLNLSKIQEAKATANAQLELAFEILDIMKERGLSPGPVAYKCLIDACGRCGDTNAATELLTRMHDDGILADGVVYSCLVSAFSTENAWRKLSGKSCTDLPEWANGASVELCVDWNKVAKPFKHHSNNDQNCCKSESSSNLRESMMNILRRVSTKNENYDLDQKKEPIRNPWADEAPTPEKFVTDMIDSHISFGENLLEIVYPDISIDTDDERCPTCDHLLIDDEVVKGWKAGDSQDYTTSCPNCSKAFVPKFRVHCTSQSFIGSRGPGTPLMCERLSPWVLEKELRTKMADWQGIDDLLDPDWREMETKNAVLWWNLILACMRYRMPFTFLLQGNFGTKNLIVPMPHDYRSPIE